MTISIRNWNDYFEVSQSRKLRGRDAKWTPMPTKHDGKTLRKILKRKDGGDIFAAFVLMVEVAAKCPVRGVLADEDRDLTPEDLSLKTGFGEKKFEKAINVLSGCDYKWLEDTGSTLVEGWEGDGSLLPLKERRGEERRVEENTIAPTRKSGSGADGVRWSSSDGFTGIEEKDRDGWSIAYPACDLVRQLAAMNEWLLGNPAKASKSQWRRFITNWLSRAQDRGGDVESKSAGRKYGDPK